MLRPQPPVIAAASLTFLHLVLNAAGHSQTFPDFQHLVVRDAIAEAAAVSEAAAAYLRRQHHSSPDAAEDNGRRELKLLHRDLLTITPSPTNHSHRFQQRMKRDARRAAALNGRLGAAPDGGGGAAGDFGSDVISGMEEGSGEYFVRIGVGSPPRSQFMVIDTGSDMAWLQCQPCGTCYPQADPIFDPTASASFASVPCGSDVCRRLEDHRCRSDLCGYQVSYRDGSYTAGTLALETLTFGRTPVRDVAIGCGTSNRGMFVGAAGLLGLGSGSMSLVGQLGGRTGGAFSYCLVSRGTNSSGWLVFGREAMPPGAAWIPLLRNPRGPAFYYVGLQGLGVGGARVPVPEGVFGLTEAGDGGTVMDTGTAVSRFPAAAYAALRDAFEAQAGGLPRTAGGMSIFDTCYDLSGFVSVRVPTVSFYFAGGRILTLPARNFLIPVDDAGTFCFGFAGTDSGLSIIGNVQQEGIQISFDEADGFVGFGPGIC